MAITGSIASTSFDDALAVLGATALAEPRRRVPMDYLPGPFATGEPPWFAPAARLPDGADGPIVRAGAALRRGDVSAVELVDDAFRAGTASVELRGIVEDVPNARLRAAVLDAELASGVDRGPLHGIPITVKDVIDVAGVATRAGSDAYHAVPDVDAEAVARLLDAGAIVIAKASTHEFALGVTSPQSRNPHDPSRIPGGSSGGSAVCVVTGAGLGSLGTDTRASIRVPAALSGAVGFKPTYGRVPTGGVLSLAWTMDHVAPLALSVTDAALMLDVLIGGSSDLAWAADSLLTGLRVGVVTAGFEGAEPDVAVATRTAIAALDDAGAVTTTTGSPGADDLALANAVGLVLSRCEAAAAHRSLKLDRSLYWDEVREQLDAADDVRAIDYLDAQRARGELRDRMRACFDAHDVLVMPTVPIVAPLVEDFARHLMLLARNAIPWSLVGFPAISVPVSTAGLPVGLQLVAAPGREDLLVAAARAVERARS